VIVRNFDLERVAILPLEADAPLLVDPDAVLALAAPFRGSNWFEAGIDRSLRSPAACSCCNFINVRITV